jgi:hypothetical protein
MPVKRTLPNRVVAVTMAMVFLLLGAGDLFGVHPCPHHDLLAAHAGEHNASHAPGTPEPPHEHEQAAPGEEATHGPCTCQGACPSSTAAEALPAHVRPAMVESVVDTPRTGVRVRDVLLPRFTPFLLPYAHGPPQLG